MNEQSFSSTVDLCCFWSSSQSHLCLIHSHSSLVSTIMPFPLEIYTSWQVSGLNLQVSIQLVTARKDQLNQNPTFVPVFKQTVTSSSPAEFYCFSSSTEMKKMFLDTHYTKDTHFISFQKTLSEINFFRILLQNNLTVLGLGNNGDYE